MQLLLLLFFCLTFSRSQDEMNCDPTTKECTFLPPGGKLTTRVDVITNTTLFPPFTSSTSFDLFLKVRHDFPIDYFQVLCLLDVNRYFLNGLEFMNFGYQMVPTLPQAPNFLNGVLFTDEAEYRDFEYPFDGPIPPPKLRPWLSYSPNQLPISQKPFTCSISSTFPFLLEEFTLIFKNVGNPCERNPCKNNGICIPTQDYLDYTCDCTRTGFLGPDCGGCVELSSTVLFLSQPESFQVVLNAKPAELAIVQLSSTCVLLNKCSLTFTPENWNIPQEVIGYPTSLEEITTPLESEPVLNCDIVAKVISHDLCDGNTVSSLGVVYNPIVVDRSFDTRTASSSGDPHFRTFDRVFHRFYDIGDFYFVRGLSGDFVVQTRQVNYGVGGSCNSGVATKFGDVVVYISSQHGIPQVSVNGDAESKEIRVREGEDSFTISNPEGIKIEIKIKTSLFLDIFVTLPDTMKTQVAGLAGFFNGNPLDDFLLPDGSLTTDENVFHQSWRVPSIEDLFLSSSAPVPDISANFPVSDSLPPSFKVCA